MVEWVSWVRLPVVVSTRKISVLPSGLPPVRSAVEVKAMRVPAALIVGMTLTPVAGVGGILPMAKARGIPPGENTKCSACSRRHLLTSPWLKPVASRRSCELGEVAGRRVHQEDLELPSALPPVRSAVDTKAMRVPAALIAGASCCRRWWRG